VADGFFHEFSGWVVYIAAFLLLFALGWALDKFGARRRKPPQNKPPQREPSGATEKATADELNETTRVVAAAPAPISLRERGADGS
jgi:hypothetical protein